MKSVLLLLALLALSSGSLIDELVPQIMKLINSLPVDTRIALMAKLTSMAVNIEKEGTPEFDLANSLLRNVPQLIVKLLEPATVGSVVSTASDLGNSIVDKVSWSSDPSNSTVAVDRASAAIRRTRMCPPDGSPSERLICWRNILNPAAGLG